ncbi:MAG: bleomycin resistance family protein [Candidatus Moraniibacteriota bacterium]|nr:MAG: bleomycin resistance family protein [Candidatus Moranbacteria bacterium]
MKKLTTNLMVEDVDATLELQKLLVLRKSSKFHTQKILQNHEPVKRRFMFQLRASLEEETAILKGVPIGGSFTLYIEVEDIQELHNNLKDKTEIVQKMHTTFYGSQEFAIKDCNGYVLAFSQPKEN